MAHLMPLPLAVSCFSKIQIGFTFLVPAHPGGPGKRAVKRVCVCNAINHQVAESRRSVGFTSDVVNQRPHSGSGLRRDTPHHLKQSRLRSNVNGQDASDRLRQMIAENPALMQPAASVPPSQHHPAPADQPSDSLEESSSFEVAIIIIIIIIIK